MVDDEQAVPPSDRDGAASRDAGQFAEDPSELIRDAGRNARGERARVTQEYRPAGLRIFRNKRCRPVIEFQNRGRAGTFMRLPWIGPHRCRSGLGVERRLGKAQVGGSIPPCGSAIWLTSLGRNLRLVVVRSDRENRGQMKS